METRVHRAVETDCIHNAEEVLMRAKMKMTEKIELSAPLKQSSVFVIHTYTHTYIHTYIHTYTHTYIHTYTHIYIHTYIHTYIRTYIHTYIHIHVNAALVRKTKMAKFGDLLRKRSYSG